VFINGVGQTINDDQLEVFAFETGSLLFRVYSGSGGEKGGNSVV